MTDQKKREPEFDPAEVRALSVAVYKARLVQDSGEGAVERMIAADKDTGEKLAGRAAAYDALTRCYMRLLVPKRQLAEAQAELLMWRASFPGSTEAVKRDALSPQHAAALPTNEAMDIIRKWVGYFRPEMPDSETIEIPIGELRRALRSAGTPTAAMGTTK